MLEPAGEAQKRIKVIQLSLSVLLIVLLVLIVLNIPSGSNLSAIDVGILTYERGGCGGVISGANWDVFGSLYWFTLGVANFDTMLHTLEQVTVTMTGLAVENMSHFEIQEIITEDGVLPLTLSPDQYWTWNFTCKHCTTGVAVQLIVDSEVLDFPQVAYNTTSNANFTRWLHLYCYPNIITPHTPSFVTIGGIVTMLGLLVILRRFQKIYKYL